MMNLIWDRLVTCILTCIVDVYNQFDKELAELTRVVKGMKIPIITLVNVIRGLAVFIFRTG